MGLVGEDRRQAEQEILRFLQLLRSPGEVAEIRIPKHNTYGHTASGYFDSMEKAAQAAIAWDGRANIYVTLNAVMPDLLARAVNRILPKAEVTTADEQMVSRRWLFLDVDATRPSGISSTKEELEAARQILQNVVQFLSGQGWPLPVEAMSGNGYSVLYRIDLPNDKEAAQLVKDVLDTLAARFDTAEAHIDTSVSNAARLIGLIGALKVKGDHTDERPHRRSFLELVSDPIGLVSVHQLRSLVSESVSKNKATSGQRQSERSRGSSLREILEQKGIEFREQPPDSRGIVWYHVAQCPFHDDGQLFECGVGQKLPDGAFAGHCFHPEGTSKGWRDWKAALGLGPDSESDLSSMHRSSEHNEGEQRSVVVTNRYLHDLADEAWELLLEANEPPSLFLYGGQIAEIALADDGRAVISHLTAPAIKGRLDRLALWVKIADEGELPSRPPNDVIQDMMALGKPLPVLRGLTGTPGFSRDGVLDATEGYQPRTGLCYVPIGQAIPAVPEIPTETELAWARDLILEDWLGDFPFADIPSRAHAVAGALTAIARELIDGPTPLIAIDAPTPGTGKGEPIKQLRIAGELLDALEDVGFQLLGP